VKRALDERLLEYGARIVALVGSLPKTHACFRIGDQVLRSGISVGAHYEEAQAVESRADFLHKLQIALKELRESRYWLRLLVRTGTPDCGSLGALVDESTELRSILSKAVATAKGKARC
jgi:four helix bundle protein